MIREVVSLGKLRAMSIPSKFLFRPMVAAVALAVALIGMSAIPACADAMLSRSQIEHRLEASGYEVTGPIVRRGATYLADVVGEGDIQEQFVIDARDGRLLRRYRVFPNYAAPPGAPAPLLSFFDRLFGAQDDVAPLPPPPADDFYDKPRAKTNLRRPKPPAAQQAKVPAENGAAPAASATPSAPPAAASAPAASPEPSHANASASAPPAPPRAATAKPNDVQVVPLE
jgi:hypothetical protein